MASLPTRTRQGRKPERCPRGAWPGPVSGGGHRDSGGTGAGPGPGCSTPARVGPNIRMPVELGGLVGKELCLNFEIPTICSL